MCPIIADVLQSILSLTTVVLLSQARLCPLRMTRWSLFIQTLYSCYTSSWDSTEVDALKRENERLKELVAQLSVENLVLKKASVRAHGQALCEKGGPAQGGGPSDRREVSSAGQADPPRVVDSTLDLLPLEEQVSRQGV